MSTGPTTQYVAPVSGFDATLPLPGSKSITNRALLLAGLSDGPSVVTTALRSDDTEAFVESLSNMGAEARWDGDTVIIDAPLPKGATGSVQCRDAGTAARFLPAAAAALGSQVRFDASDQLRARPIADLLGALRAQGARVDGNHFPFDLSSDGLVGGHVELGGNISSQFLSGLLMAGPLAHEPLTIHVQGLVSRPYVDLTVGMMRSFGRTVDVEGYDEFRVHDLGRYRAPAAGYAVEADASTASYFFAAAAATGSRICVTNIDRSSPQGDIRFLQILEQMGAKVIDGPDGVVVEGPSQLHGLDVDMGDVSDVMMTLACIAPLADSPTRIRNVPHARVKESDRIAAVIAGMARLGIRTEEGPDWLVVHPGEPTPSSIETFRDHRIAMSFSVLGLATGAVTIEDPACVGKTCPQFFELLDLLSPSV